MAYDETGNGPMGSVTEGMPGRTSTKKIGEILIQEGAIAPDQLREALTIQQDKGGFLGQILVDLGYVRQGDIVSSLVKQCKIPHLSLLDYDITPEVAKLVPQETCLKYDLIPIDKLGRILTVAMVNPLDTEALEEIRRICPDLRIKPILCDWKHFAAVVQRVFGLETKEEPKDYDPGELAPPRKSPAPQKHEPPKAQPASDGLDAALDAVVNEVIREAERAEPSPSGSSRPEPAPAALPSLDLGEMRSMIQAEVGGALQEALASMAAQTSARDARDATAAEELAPIIREAFSNAFEERLSHIEARLDDVRQGGAAPASHELAGLVRNAMRDALAEGESSIVAFRGPGESPSYQGRGSHAPAGPARMGRKRVADFLDQAEPDNEEDAGILDAMEGDELIEGMTFETFFTGANNAFTMKVCQAISAKPGKEYNPLFVYGDVGVGKTHLVNALGHALVERNPAARVGYASASRFASRLSDALHAHAVESFREEYCHWDLLAFDDVQSLAGHVEAQEEFLHMLSALERKGRQVVVVGDKAPTHQRILDPRLASRLSSGIVTHLRAPDWETRVRILHHHAEAHQAPMGDDVLGLVATRVNGDVRKLIGALRKIMAYAELLDSKVTGDTVVEILSHLGIEDVA